MEEMITVRELLASIAWRWKKVVAVTLCMAALLGAVQAVRLFAGHKADPESAENEYAEAMEKYQRELTSLTKQQEEAALALQQAEDYIDRSLLMRLNPYDVCSYTAIYTVLAEDGGSLQQSDNTDSDTVALMCQDYATYWRYGNTPMDLHSTEYADTGEKYVRELVTVQAEGRVLCVTVNGTAEEDCRALSAAVESYLAEKTEEMVPYTYPHKLEQIEAGMHRDSDPAIALAQSDAQSRITEQEETVKSLEKQLKELQEPEKAVASSIGSASARALIKYAVIGGFIGLLLACLLILWGNIASKKAESSLQVERTLKIPFLGNIDQAAGKADRLFQKISGERTWETPDAALLYAVERISCGHNGKERIVLALADRETASPHSLAELKAHLEKQGVCAELVGDFNRNPKAVEALGQCDTVILVGRAHRSKLNDLAEIVFCVQQAGKSVKGFIMA